MKTTLDILVAARALIEKPENWCQGTAFNGHGGRCAVGAVVAVRLDSLIQHVKVTGALRKQLPRSFKPNHGVDKGPIVQFNDSHTHQDVLDLFDRAIAAEKHKFGIDDKIAGQVQDLLRSAVASTAVPESVT